MFGILKKIFGSKEDREKKALAPLINEINAFTEELKRLSNDDLRNKTVEFRKFLSDHLADIDHDIRSAEEDAARTSDVQEKQRFFDEVDELKKKRDKLLEELLMELLPEAFAVVREAARRFSENTEIVVSATQHDLVLAAQNKDFVRIEGDKAVWSNSWTAAGTQVTWNMVHYDVQLHGGIVLHQGKIAEMATGEGKTLVSTLPAYLNGLSGLGVHIVTVNNYLARRDAEWMGPLHQFLLLTVGCIDLHQPHSPGRKDAYTCDIVYGTNNEFGFDYLRDNMARSIEETVQRKFHYAMVDEVDSVLIDDARTPLIISGPVGKDDQTQLFQGLKPRIEQLYEKQKQLAIRYIQEAKQLIAEGKTGNGEGQGGLALLRAHRALPKFKPLIKFLSEPGMRALLVKTENHYLQEQARNMPLVDEPLYFVIEEKQRSVQFKKVGLDFITRSGEDPELFVLPDVAGKMAAIESSGMEKAQQDEEKAKLLRHFQEKSELIHSLDQLLKAYTLFEKEDEYVVMDGLVKIVDEQTGRILEGRRYSDGLHQAIEAKENVKIEKATQTYATITLQNFFRMYHKLAGMTGTAETEAQEFWDIYKLDVSVIPTHRQIIRKDLDDKVYKTEREKINAIVDEIDGLQQKGRPVLVGTTSVEKSELISRVLIMRKIPHNVLNAKHHQREADIVAEAGRTGQVTIATNMAGRGTDIKLGPGVKEAGGLAIIGTERHDSRRVDRQLRGRAGRQGDPGSSQFFVSLEDRLMRLFGSERIAGVMDKLGHQEGDVIQAGMVTSSIERAQKKVEENNFGVRKRLLDYDNVMNVQREAIYRMRNNALNGIRLSVDISDMFFQLGSELIEKNRSGNFDDFSNDLLLLFGIDPPFDKATYMAPSVKSSDLYERLYEALMHRYDAVWQERTGLLMPVIEHVFSTQGNQFERIAVPFAEGKKGLEVALDMREALESQGANLRSSVEKNIVLALIDHEWKDHLRLLDELKDSVQTSAYTEQKDPLVIYKKEAYLQFEYLIGHLRRDIASFLFNGKIPIAQESDVRQARQAPKQRTQNVPTATNRAAEPDEDPNGDGQEQPAKPRPVPVVNADPKVGRNDPCPCGSGKKFKACHGR
jgi:preprotein translocase subunit SecA